MGTPGTGSTTASTTLSVASRRTTTMSFAHRLRELLHDRVDDRIGEHRARPPGQDEGGDDSDRLARSDLDTERTRGRNTATTTATKKIRWNGSGRRRAHRDKAIRRKAPRKARTSSSSIQRIDGTNSPSRLVRSPSEIESSRAITSSTATSYGWRSRSLLHPRGQRLPLDRLAAAAAACHRADLVGDVGGRDGSVPVRPSAGKVADADEFLGGRTGPRLPDERCRSRKAWN